jgi:adenylate cyclase class IV
MFRTLLFWGMRRYLRRFRLVSAAAGGYTSSVSFEIELKARVEDCAACRRRMEDAAGTGTALSKDDVYWIPPAAAQTGLPGSDLPGSGLPGSGLRVRREQTAGTERTLVTWKTKEKRSGIEVNSEKELSVSDAALCEELLAALGLRKRTVKHKEGWAWKTGDITAELCEVSGFTAGKDGAAGGETPVSLGWFLELEIIAGDAAPETVSAARGRLFTLLEKAGLGENALESRYYTEMLAASQEALIYSIENKSVLL